MGFPWLSVFCFYTDQDETLGVLNSTDPYYSVIQNPKGLRLVIFAYIKSPCKQPTLYKAWFFFWRHWFHNRRFGHQTQLIR